MRFVNFAIVSAGTLLLTACASTGSETYGQDYYAAKLDSPFQAQSRIKAKLPEEVAPIETQYTCEDGENIRLRSYKGIVASVILPQISEARAYLEGRPSDEGFRYTAGPLEIFGNYEEILISDGSDLDVICEATG